jgi:hypothetical protein
MSAFLRKEGLALVHMYNLFVRGDNEFTTIHDIGEALGIDKTGQQLIAQNLTIYLRAIKAIDGTEINIPEEERGLEEEHWQKIYMLPIELTEEGKMAAERLVRFIELPYFNPPKRDYAV